MVYDIIVIGGGHAGVEAALASARMGHHTLLITLDKTKIASMPCNPAIGGPAKGIVVREIDALGGEMAKAADKTALQFKLLNSSRGPAVQAIRVQSDKIAYSKYMQDVVNKQKNLDVLEAMVENLLIENNILKGVLLKDETVIYCQKLILTTGTYMEAKILRGKEIKKEGPDGQKGSYGISKQLLELGFEVIRLKTGTPPRIAKDSINYENMALELGSDLKLAFSSTTKTFLPLMQQEPCWLIYTNNDTHTIIRDNINESPMYANKTDSVPTRYCPSIEDKIVRFYDKPRHQIFLEPESKQLDTIYVQGFSTSMPIEIQEKMVRSLPGLENAKILKWAYAIEYDAIDPIQLYPTLETKLIKNLFTAGQINGTSGYEEAACQGLMAAINAHLQIINKPPLILKRSEAYIGVLIDDLVTKGTKEPYRLLTSRAEFRLLLRNDNAEERLMKYGYQLGLIDQARWDEQQLIFSNQEKVAAQLKLIRFTPKLPIQQDLIKHNFAPLREGISAFELLIRPEITINFLENYVPIISTLNEFQKANLSIKIKFSGYLEQQEKEILINQKFEKKQIPDNINYDHIESIALEAKEKLKKIRPLTIGQAARISGVNPADIQMLLVFLKKKYPYLNK